MQMHNGMLLGQNRNLIKHYRDIKLIHVRSEHQ